jgi:phosphoribosyl-AMP cyclohydrolase
MGLTRWQWYYNKTQHTNNTPHSKTKYSTQTYTSNKEDTTQNEYNANMIFSDIKFAIVLENWYMNRAILLKSISKKIFVYMSMDKNCLSIWCNGWKKQVFHL